MGSDASSRFVLLGGFGLAMALAGVALRFWPGLESANSEVSALIGLFALFGTAATWLARPPRLGAAVFYPLFFVAIWGLGVAAMVLVLPHAMAREALPRALESCGGALWLLASAGRCASILARGWLPAKDSPSKIKARRVRSDGSTSTVSASTLEPGERFDLVSGDVVPVDGRITSGTVAIDEHELYASHEPRTAQPKDHVLAGAQVVDGRARVEVVHRADASVVSERNRRAEELRDLALRPERTLRGAAVTALVVGLAVLAAGVWLRVRLDAPDWQGFVTSHAALLLAVCPAIPVVALLRGRTAALDGAMGRGIWFTRPGDAAAFFGVRRWRMDPMLLAAPGPVDVLTFARAPASDLLRWAEAVARPWRGPERASLAEALRKQSLESAEATAVKASGGLRYGTVEGQRIVLGTPEAFDSERDVRLDSDQASAIRFLRERPGQVWLIASDAEGLLGALGVGVDAESGAKSCFEALDARLLPMKDEAALRAVAEAVGTAARPKAPRAGDGTLLAAETESPSRGLRVRVLEFRSSVRLFEQAAPRIVRGALAHFPETVERARSLRGGARGRAWGALAICALVAAGLVAGRVMEPAFAALVGRLGLLLAFTPSSLEPPLRRD